MKKKEREAEGYFGCIEIGKKLAVLGRIYALGLLNEDEYTKVKNRIMREHGLVTFEAV